MIRGRIIFQKPQIRYMPYKWLCGRNGAYIDTNYIPSFGNDVFNINARYDGTTRNPDGYEQDIFGVNQKSLRISAYINGNNRLSCNYFKIGSNYWPSTGVTSTEWDIKSLMISGSNFTFTANGTQYTFSNQSATAVDYTLTILLFNTNQGVLENYFHGDISHFRITDPTFTTDRVNMTPVQLLAPIPPSLDANGIRRKKGECGMLDSVSGLFFGNVGSGAFTVSDN